MWTGSKCTQLHKNAHKCTHGQAREHMCTRGCTLSKQRDTELLQLCGYCAAILECTGRSLSALEELQPWEGQPTRGCTAIPGPQQRPPPWLWRQLAQGAAEGAGARVGSRQLAASPMSLFCGCARQLLGRGPTNLSFWLLSPTKSQR